MLPKGKIEYLECRILSSGIRRVALLAANLSYLTYA